MKENFDSEFCNGVTNKHFTEFLKTYNSKTVSIAFSFLIVKLNQKTLLANEGWADAKKVSL